MSADGSPPEWVKPASAIVQSVVDMNDEASKAIRERYRISDEIDRPYSPETSQPK